VVKLRDYFGRGGRPQLQHYPVSVMPRPDSQVFIWSFSARNYHVCEVQELSAAKVYHRLRASQTFTGMLSRPGGDPRSRPHVSRH